jgi:hypothetical protein
MNLRKYIREQISEGISNNDTEILIDKQALKKAVEKYIDENPDLSNFQTMRSYDNSQEDMSSSINVVTDLNLQSIEDDEFWEPYLNNLNLICKNKNPWAKFSKYVEG